MNQRVKRWSAWIFVVVWMSAIFYLSHQPADVSSAMSTGIVQKVIETLESISKTTFSDTGWMHYAIRKGAHLFAYFLLAILLLNACKQMGWKRVIQITITLGGSALYAVTDEIHQLYIPGRSGEVSDVLIDTSGAILGIFLFIFLERLFKNKQEKNSA